MPFHLTSQDEPFFFTSFTVVWQRWIGIYFGQDSFQVAPIDDPQVLINVSPLYSWFWNCKSMAVLEMSSIFLFSFWISLRIATGHASAESCPRVNCCLRSSFWVGLSHVIILASHHSSLIWLTTTELHLFLVDIFLMKISFFKN